MDYWFCVSVCLCVSVFSRERHNVEMLRASLSESLVYGRDRLKGACLIYCNCETVHDNGYIQYNPIATSSTIGHFRGVKSMAEPDMTHEHGVLCLCTRETTWRSTLVSC